MVLLWFLIMKLRDSWLKQLLEWLKVLWKLCKGQWRKALLWHSQFIRIHGNNVSLGVYKQAIMTRFGNVYDDLMSELKILKYETTAREYEDAFDNLLGRVETSDKIVRQTELHYVAMCVFPNSVATCMQIEEVPATSIHPILQQVIAAYEDVFAVPAIFQELITLFFDRGSKLTK
ncbi:hypothetical protein Tco_1220111 [Tanacetum coccineum]